MVSVAEVTRDVSTPPLNGILVHCRVAPSIKFVLLDAVRETMRVNCLAQVHDTMPRSRTMRPQRLPNRSDMQTWKNTRVSSVGHFGVVFASVSKLVFV